MIMRFRLVLGKKVLMSWAGDGSRPSKGPNMVNAVVPLVVPRIACRNTRCLLTVFSRVEKDSEFTQPQPTKRKLSFIVTYELPLDTSSSQSSLPNTLLYRLQVQSIAMV